MRRTAYTLLLGVAMTMAACQSPAPDEAEVSHHDAEAPGHEAEAGHDEPGQHDEAGHAAHGDGDAHEALPLRPIMQQLGANMAGLTYALWLEDYDQMAMYADDIADHTHISEEELQRIRDELGQEMDRFLEADEAVHEASMRLHEAVEARDMDGILLQLSEVQAGCMACHTQFRERLRTDQPAP